MMVNNLYESELSFHAGLRKPCHLYIQSQVSDTHEKILIHHWRRIWNPHFSWTQQQQNGKAKNIVLHAKRKPFSTLTGTTRIFRLQYVAVEGNRNGKTGKLREKEPEFPRSGKFFRKRTELRRNAPETCAEKRAPLRTMSCRQQASGRRTGPYGAIGRRMAFPAGVEPSLCRWRDGLPDR